MAEIRLADGGEFDVTFTKDAMILQPSKKPTEDVDPQEKTPLRQSS